MKISYNWLKSYVDVKVPAEKLAELLTMSGLPVESVEKIKGDYILEIEVTSNRSDCLSIIGVAREVSAITGAKLKTPSVAAKKRLPAPASQPTVSIKVEDKKLCPRYTARVINNVKVGESPAWLKERIEVMGLRPVNNIVDITNFCLFETGEPMHAFDLDKISGKEIIIRRAKKGDRLTTIDGEMRILNDSDLIIADKARPIAIAGVMGGLHTEVTNSTKNILLEAASFDPISTRRTSRRLGISTESSYRFERRVDLENIIYSSNRATELILKLAGGSVGELADIGKKSEKARTANLRYSRLNEVLGLDIPSGKVRNILNSLGIKAVKQSKAALKLKAPSFRYDLQSEIDVIEEVSRIYGYGKIPKSIPLVVEQPTRKSFEMIVDGKIRKILTSLGLDEIITYSLLSKRSLAISGAINNNVLEIMNPLSSEQEVMRPSLITGMLGTMIWNINRKAEHLELFELGKVYLKKSDGTFAENKHLSMGITGQIYSSWDGRSRTSWFSDLMGPFEVLLSEFGVDPFSYSLTETKDERFSPAACASIKIKNELIGIAGEVSPKVLTNFDIKDKVYVLEIDTGALLKYISLEKTFRELPKYPSAHRDISIIVGKEITNTELTNSMREAGSSILKDIKLIDRYTGRQIPGGKVSLTYRLEYQDAKKTLEEKDVSAAHSRILQALEGKFGARLR